MNVLGKAVLLLSGCNPRQEPQTPSSEFWPDPSAKAEVYLQSNCQIQASDTAAPNQLAFNEQLPRSGVSSAFGWCAAMQWERPRWSSGDPKGVLAYAFSLITQMHSRFSCWCPPDIDLTDHDSSLSWQTTPKQMPFPTFHAYDFPAGFLRTTGSVTLTGILTSQSKIWATDTADFIVVETAKSFLVIFHHLSLLRILLTAFSILNNKQPSICIFSKSREEWS